MRSVLRVDEATEVSIDDARTFNHFLRVQAGPARLDLSLDTASALHDLLNDYFGPPEPLADSVAVLDLSEHEPIAYLPTVKAEAMAPDLQRALRDSLSATAKREAA